MTRRVAGLSHCAPADKREPDVQALIHPPTHTPTQPSIHPATHLSVYPPIHPPIHFSIHLSVYPAIQPFIYLLIHPSTHPPVHPSIHPSIPTELTCFACSLTCPHTADGGSPSLYSMCDRPARVTGPQCRAGRADVINPGSDEGRLRTATALTVRCESGAGEGGPRTAWGGGSGFGRLRKPASLCQCPEAAHSPSHRGPWGLLCTLHTSPLRCAGSRVPAAAHLVAPRCTFPWACWL